MKTVMTLMAFMAMLITLPVQALEIGKPAPDFSVVDSNGATRSLGEFLGQDIVLEWTNHGCPYVKKFYNDGAMQSLQEQVTSSGAIWLRVISSAPGKQGHVSGDEANKIAQDQGVHATATLLDSDGSVGRAYNAKTTPHMYVVNKQGVLVYQGAIDDKPGTNSADIEGATNYVTAALDDLNAGRDVQTALTQPYGCSIKY